MQLLFITRIYKFLPFLQTALSIILTLIVYKYTIMDNVFADELYIPKRPAYADMTVSERQDHQETQFKVVIGLIIGIMIIFILEARGPQ